MIRKLVSGIRLLVTGIWLLSIVAGSWLLVSGSASSQKREASGQNADI